MTLDARTRACIKEVSEATSQRTVERTLTALGIDHTKPIDMQKDMAALGELRKIYETKEYRADAAYVRRQRTIWLKIKEKGLLTVVGLGATGGAVWLWTIFKDKIGL